MDIPRNAPRMLGVLMCAAICLAALPAEGKSEAAAKDAKKAMYVPSGITMIDAAAPSSAAAAAADEGVAKALPKAEDMKIDPLDYYGQVVRGYYAFDCVVSKGTSRTAKFYIPDGSAYNQPTVFVMVPGGTDTYRFLVDSGWKAVADSRKLYVVMMESAPGGWADAKSETAYIDALREDVSFRPFFCTFSSNFYAIAYGAEAAEILAQDSLRKPANWAGIALLGTDGIKEELAEEMRRTASKVPGVAMSQVLQPAWIVSAEKTEDVARLVDFFRAANHSEYEATPASYAEEVFLPREGGTVDNEWCAKVVYARMDWKSCLNETYSASIYDNLLQGVYRYPGDSNGALRQNDSIYSRGFQKFAALVPGGFKSDNSDVYRREWWVYVPKSVDRTKPAPMVFVFHGAGGSGDEIADRSGWATVADEKGLIIVCPTGSHVNTVRKVSDIVTSELFRAMWNTEDKATETRPNDLLFVRYLYDWMKGNYAIDESRVYASGQSSGGAMTWATAIYCGDIIAAAAPVSANGTLSPLPSKAEGPVVPIIAFIGELDGSFKGGFGSEPSKAIIDYWTTRNATVQKWDAYTYMDGGKKASYVSDTFTNYVFSSAGGVPLLRCIEVATKTHAILPSEGFIAWNECLSKFTRDRKTGTLYYNGAALK